MNHQTRTWMINEADVNDAYEAYCELQKLAASKPRLIDNPHFRALQDSAYARFRCRFEAR